MSANIMSTLEIGGHLQLLLHYVQCVDSDWRVGVPNWACISIMGWQNLFVCCLFDLFVGNLDAPGEVQGSVCHIGDVKDVQAPSWVIGDGYSQVFQFVSSCS